MKNTGPEIELALKESTDRYAIVDTVKVNNQKFESACQAFGFVPSGSKDILTKAKLVDETTNTSLDASVYPALLNRKNRTGIANYLEILNTEADYINDLEAAKVGITKALINYKPEKDFATLTELQDILAKLDELIKAQYDMLASLHEPEPDKWVQTLQGKLTIYAEFIALTTNKQFPKEANIIFENVMVEHDRVKSGINSYCIKPVQRPGKYVLMLRDLIGNVASDHEILPVLHKAYKDFDEFGLAINAAQASTENEIGKKILQKVIDDFNKDPRSENKFEMLIKEIHNSTLQPEIIASELQSVSFYNFSKKQSEMLEVEILKLSTAVENLVKNIATKYETIKNNNDYINKLKNEGSDSKKYKDEEKENVALNADVRKFEAQKIKTSSLHSLLTLKINNDKIIGPLSELAKRGARKKETPQSIVLTEIIAELQSQGLKGQEANLKDAIKQTYISMATRGDASKFYEGINDVKFPKNILNKSELDNTLEDLKKLEKTTTTSQLSETISSNDEQKEKSKSYSARVGNVVRKFTVGKRKSSSDATQPSITATTPTISTDSNTSSKEAVRSTKPVEIMESQPPVKKVEKSPQELRDMLMVMGQRLIQQNHTNQERFGSAYLTVIDSDERKEDQLKNLKDLINIVNELKTDKNDEIKNLAEELSSAIEPHKIETLVDEFRKLDEPAEDTKQHSEVNKDELKEVPQASEKATPQPTTSTTTAQPKAIQPELETTNQKETATILVSPDYLKQMFKSAGVDSSSPSTAFEKYHVLGNSLTEHFFENMKRLIQDIIDDHSIPINVEDYKKTKFDVISDLEDTHPAYDGFHITMHAESLKKLVEVIGTKNLEVIDDDNNVFEEIYDPGELKRNETIAIEEATNQSKPVTDDTKNHSAPQRPTKETPFLVEESNIKDPIIEKARISELKTYLKEPTIPQEVAKLADKGHENYKSGKIVAQDEMRQGGRKAGWLKETFNEDEKIISDKLKDIPPPKAYSISEISSAFEETEKLQSAQKPSFTIVEGVSVNDLQRRALAKNAVLQVASQFNYLEAFSKDDKASVESYLYDPTQGPQASIEAAAAAIHRKVAEDNGSLRHALEQVIPANLLDKCYKNGYLEIFSLNRIEKSQLLKILQNDNNLKKLCVLPQWVKCEASGEMQLQVFNAAPSFQYQAQPKEGSPEDLICKKLVVAQYVATAQLAVIRSRELGEPVPLHLTLIGQSAFNNHPSVMKEAMEKVADVVKGEKVNVFVHAYRPSDKDKLINSLNLNENETENYKVQFMDKDQFKTAVSLEFGEKDAINADVAKSTISDKAESETDKILSELKDTEIATEIFSPDEIAKWDKDFNDISHDLENLFKDAPSTTATKRAPLTRDELRAKWDQEKQEKQAKQDDEKLEITQFQQDEKSAKKIIVDKLLNLIPHDKTQSMDKTTWEAIMQTITKLQSPDFTKEDIPKLLNSIEKLDPRIQNISSFVNKAETLANLEDFDQYAKRQDVEQKIETTVPEKKEQQGELQKPEIALKQSTAENVATITTKRVPLTRDELRAKWDQEKQEKQAKQDEEKLEITQFQQDEKSAKKIIVDKLLNLIPQDKTQSMGKTTWEAIMQTITKLQSPDFTKEDIPKLLNSIEKLDPRIQNISSFVNKAETLANLEDFDQYLKRQDVEQKIETTVPEKKEQQEELQKPEIVLEQSNAFEDEALHLLEVIQNSAPEFLEKYMEALDKFSISAETREVGARQLYEISEKLQNHQNPTVKESVTKMLEALKIEEPQLIHNLQLRKFREIGNKLYELSRADSFSTPINFENWLQIQNLSSAFNENQPNEEQLKEKFLALISGLANTELKTEIESVLYAWKPELLEEQIKNAERELEESQIELSVAETTLDEEKPTDSISDKPVKKNKVVPSIIETLKNNNKPSFLSPHRQRPTNPDSLSQPTQQPESIPVRTEIAQIHHLSSQNLYSKLERMKGVAGELNKYGIKNFAQEPEHIKIEMQTSIDKTIEVQVKQTPDMKNDTYNMQSNISDEDKKIAITNICKLAVATAKPGSTFNIPAADEAQRKITEDALNDALSKKYPGLHQPGVFKIPEASVCLLHAKLFAENNDYDNLANLIHLSLFHEKASNGNPAWRINPQELSSFHLLIEKSKNAANGSCQELIKQRDEFIEYHKQALNGITDKSQAANDVANIPVHQFDLTMFKNAVKAAKEAPHQEPLVQEEKKEVTTLFKATPHPK